MPATASKRKPAIKLTKQVIGKLKSAHGPRPEIFWDTELKGFGVLVSGKTTKKTYVVQYGAIPRRTIGRCDLVSLDEARKDAIYILGKLVRGIDPKQERRDAQLALYESAAIAERLDLTLRQVFDSFAAARKDVRPVTIAGYRRLLTNYLQDWLDRPLRGITRDEIERRHELISEIIKGRGRNKLSTGHASANGTMRVLRIVWNYSLAREMIPGLGMNPVSMLSKIRAWYPEGRRDTVIPQTQLPAFFEAVRKLGNPIHSDLILLMLFTGLRVGEATSLRWSNIDFGERVIRIPALKTKSGKKLDLPMSTFVHDLLNERRAACPVGEWVFPGNSKEGHAKEPKAALERTSKASHLPYYAPHDLRRTFITVAESCDISVYALKGLVNHSTGSDVTAGYVQLGQDRLREAAQKVTERLLNLVSADFSDSRTLAS